MNLSMSFLVFALFALAAVAEPPKCPSGRGVRHVSQDSLSPKCDNFSCGKKQKAFNNEQCGCGCRPLKGCTLTGGRKVKHGFSGKDQFPNQCNTCKCDDGILGCTKALCDNSCNGPKDCPACTRCDAGGCLAQPKTWNPRPCEICQCSKNGKKEICRKDKSFFCPKIKLPCKRPIIHKGECCPSCPKCREDSDCAGCEKCNKQGRCQTRSKKKWIGEKPCIQCRCSNNGKKEICNFDETLANCPVEEPNCQNAFVHKGDCCKKCPRCKEDSECSACETCNKKGRCEKRSEKTWQGDKPCDKCWCSPDGKREICETDIDNAICPLVEPNCQGAFVHKGDCCKTCPKCRSDLDCSSCDECNKVNGRCQSRGGFPSAPWGDVCAPCECIDGDAACRAIICVPEDELPCVTPIRLDGECCPVCPPGSGSGSGAIDIDCSDPNLDGATWKPDVCTDCVCENQMAVCRSYACEALPCPYEDQITLEGECCPVCRPL